MRRRIGGNLHTGLGGGAGPELMNGKETADKKLNAVIRAASKEVYTNFFQGTKIDYKGVDAGVDGDEVRIGIEPTYMFDPLKAIVIHKNKERSYFITGICRGPWGSGIQSKQKEYGDYVRSSKFVRFIDKWHPKLFQNK